jgi:hypothetical protein
MALLIEELEVGVTALRIKFLRTVKVSSITDNKFSLTNLDLATPALVASPFKAIQVGADYNTVSRILSLYYGTALLPNTSYRLTVTGLEDPLGQPISGESVPFESPAVTIPGPNDPVQAPIDLPPVEIVDYTIKGDPLTGDILTTPDGFQILWTDPPLTDPIIVPGYHDGRITVRFSDYPSPLQVNDAHIKVQRKKMQREYGRWESVPVHFSLDTLSPSLFVDFPSTDSTPVYHTAGKEYFPLDYKYRLRINRDMDSAGTGAIGSGNTLALVINQGATFSRSISFLQANGTPRDLTGYTARMQIKTAIGGTLVVELNTSNGDIVIEPLLGRITMVLSASQTTALPALTGVYDLELYSPDATPVVTRLLEGSVTISPEVTT